MPRVPPVTTATRAMAHPLYCVFVSALGFDLPSFKLATNNAAQHFDPREAVVEAGEIGEVGAAGGEECGPPAYVELLEGLEAVGGESRREQGYAPYALGGERGERRVGRGLEPFGAA